MPAYRLMLLLFVAALLAGASGWAQPSDPGADLVAQVAAALNPSLVRIHVVAAEYTAGRETKREGTGSGVILTSEGHVITNHHAAGNAKQITCTLAGGEEMDAVLVGTDPLTDISVIKLQPKEHRQFSAARFGDSSALRVGDRVLAMGSPLALTQSVTMGIVSNTQLVIPDLFWPLRFEVDGEDVGSFLRWIGHDADISPGNSGGPLVNLAGEVVGINEMQFGLGAAIPGNLARQAAEQLIAHGTVRRAWLGLEVQPLLKSRPAAEGVLVSGALPGSPAQRAGFRAGDVIISLAGQKVSVRLPEELPLFNQQAAALPIGEEVKAEVFREGKTVTLALRPQERERTRPQERELSAWGITARDLSAFAARELRRDTRDGVLVTSTRPGGPCDTAKPRISDRDVITEVAGKPVRSVDELQKATEALLTGKEGLVPTVVAFERRGERYLTVVQVGTRPEPGPAQEAQKAWLAAATQVLTSDMAEALQLAGRTGVRVTQVYPGRAAARAGLQVGDIIVALDGEPIPAFRVEHAEVFPAMVRQRQVGAEAELSVLRGGEEKRLTVVLERSPRLPRELRKYEDKRFELTARDLPFEDCVRNQWPEDQQGVLVEAVSQGGWAALGHLAVGDLILEVDGKAVGDVSAFEQVMEEIGERQPQAVVFHARRGIHELYIELRPRWPAKD